MVRNCAVWSDDPGRREAYAAAYAFGIDGRVDSRGAYRFALFITGEFSRGKTWLATAAFVNLLIHHKIGMWRTFHGFIREVQATYKSGATVSADEAIGAYQRTPVLLLDDVGDLQRRKEETEDRIRLLHEVIDYRNSHMTPTIITTNLLPEDMRVQFGDRTFQRVLEMSAFVEMAGANLREVAA